MSAPQHVRVTWSGTLGTTATEIWSMGLAFTPNALSEADDVPALATMETAAAAMRAAWATHLAPKCATNIVKLTRTRVALIGDDGRTERTGAGAYKHKDDVTVVNATGTSSGFPFQVAMAITTLSERAGRTGRGRFYLPLPAVLVGGTDGLLSDANRDAFATAADGFITACRSAAAAGWDGLPVIASAGSALDNLEPALLPIMRIKVGKALDTLRSRRNALDETYSIPLSVLD
jgi:hypothetical protein